MAKINGFKLAAKAADKKSIIPILNQVYVSDGRAIATNCDIEIIAPCDMPDGAYNVRGEPVAVPADRADYVSLSTPELDGAEDKYIGDLAAMLARVAPAMSKEETRYYLNGVFFEFKGGLKLTAVDGHKLLHFAPEDSVDYPEIEPFILPRETVNHICAVKCGVWFMKATKTRVEFRDSVSGVVIRSKFVDGSFPEYTRVIPKGGFRETISGDAKACLAVAERCAKYGADRSKAVKIEGKSLTMRPADIAPLEIEWPVTIDNDGGDPITIGFNAGYIRDMLTIAAMDKAAQFAFQLRDYASPIRVDFPACPGLVGVVMPLRV